MKKTTRLLSLLIAAPLLVAAQTPQSPYAGQERRPVKTLSAEEVQSYLTGQGMGFAKAAELNSYPGPKHALELAGQLGLSKDQVGQTERARVDMLAEATRLGRLIVERERGLDAAFARGTVDEAGLSAAVGEIARLQGELRLAHLRAHLVMKRVLSPEQVKKYDELRGYGAKPAGHDPSRHSHHE